MYVGLLTHTSPFILPQLQPCRGAEAADLPLYFLTTVLTVGKRACPGICVHKHKQKTQIYKNANVATVGFSVLQVSMDINGINGLTGTRSIRH